jgi:hypothetical protein
VHYASPPAPEATERYPAAPAPDAPPQYPSLHTPDAAPQYPSLHTPDAAPQYPSLPAADAAPNTGAPPANSTDAATTPWALSAGAPHDSADAATSWALTAGAPHADSADAASIRWALSAGAPPQPAVRSRAKFGLIAMIAGIVAAVFAVIPGLSFAAWIPAFVAIGLGIVGYLGGRPRAFALTGIITGGAALAVGTAVSIWFLAQLGVLG